MTQLELIPHFDGSSYEPEHDQQRLFTQLERVRALMLAGQWWTLPELHKFVGGSEAGLSARIRDLRKARFGGYQVERRRVEGGLFEYRLEAK